MALELPRVQYQEVSVETVIADYVSRFQPNKGEKIFQYDWFYDTDKRTVVFKLFIQEKKDG